MLQAYKHNRALVASHTSTIAPLSSRIVGFINLTVKINFAIIAISFLAMICPMHTKAQNLFANPGLEDINVCTEYTATCSEEAWFYFYPTEIPFIDKALPERFQGKNTLWLPVMNIYDPFGQKQIIYTMLLCPLVKGKTYKLSFYINSLNRKFYKTELGFSTKEPNSKGFTTKSINTIFPVTEADFEKDLPAGIPRNWHFVEKTFIAKGDELFFLIGNLSNEVFPYTVADRMSTKGMVYYFADEFMLKALDNTPLCATADKMKERMYAQNYRHTNKTVFDPAIIEPQFTYDTIKVPNAYFETNKSVLKPEFTILMDSITRRISNRYISKIDIIGHTDSRGTAENNLILSLQRAQSVKNFMIKRIPKIAPFTFTIGKGQTQPVDDNETEIGRANNRRVEIILTLAQLYRQN